MSGNGLVPSVTSPPPKKKTKKTTTNKQKTKQTKTNKKQTNKKQVLTNFYDAIYGITIQGVDEGILDIRIWFTTQ